jgi:hypothetical protein
MFLFIDGQIVILTVEQNIDLYYQTYVAEFGEISRTRWEGSKEYEIAYANAERDFQNAVIIEQGLQIVFDSISEINEEIKRPAVLYSRVPERFAEEIDPVTDLPYIASIRIADISNKGIVAICVDYTPEPTQNTFIANLLVNECLPAGQCMEGDISEAVVISNGQSVLAQWKAPVLQTNDFKITITLDKNSPFPVDTADDVAAKFLANFNAQNQLGNDITPATYYQIALDAPYAADIATTYDIDTSGVYIGTVTASNYDDKYTATLDPINVTFV